MLPMRLGRNDRIGLGKDMCAKECRKGTRTISIGNQRVMLVQLESVDDPIQHSDRWQPSTVLQTTCIRIVAPHTGGKRVIGHVRIVAVGLPVSQREVGA